MSVIQLDPELRAWQRFDDAAFNLNFIFFFGHTYLPNN
jgi:hypothetical protein